jgi:hypothetical protein
MNRELARFGPRQGWLSTRAGWHLGCATLSQMSVLLIVAHLGIRPPERERFAYPDIYR